MRSLQECFSSLELTYGEAQRAQNGLPSRSALSTSLSKASPYQTRAKYPVSLKQNEGEGDNDEPISKDAGEPERAIVLNGEADALAIEEARHSGVESGGNASPGDYAHSLFLVGDDSSVPFPLTPPCSPSPAGSYWSYHGPRPTPRTFYDDESMSNLIAPAEGRDVHDVVVMSLMLCPPAPATKPSRSLKKRRSAPAPQICTNYALCNNIGLPAERVLRQSSGLRKQRQSQTAPAKMMNVFKRVKWWAKIIVPAKPLLQYLNS